MSLTSFTTSQASEAGSGGATTAERRYAERQMSVFISAKLIANGCECPCRVHNLSPHGAKIETSLDLHIMDVVTIEFRSDLIAHGAVRWRADNVAGIEFDDAFDVDRLLKKLMPSIARVKPRPPRYQCSIPATIASEEVNYLCRVIDISTSGLKIFSPCRLRRGDVVMIKVEGLLPHKAKVIWCDRNLCGLKLQNPYTYDEIRMRLVTEMPLERHVVP